MYVCVMCTWYVGMGDIEILSYDNHPPKYHNYYIYNDIHLVSYNNAVKLKSQAYGMILFRMSNNFDVLECIYIILTIVSQ